MYQIYQRAGNVNLSKKYFELVLKSNPEYEMVFNVNEFEQHLGVKRSKQMRDNLIQND